MERFGQNEFRGGKQVLDAEGRVCFVAAVDASGGNDEYQAVAAGQTDKALGATGALGDYVSHLVIVPATAAAGAVSLKDGAGGAMSIFAGGGTTALPTLAPIVVFLGMRSKAGAWLLTTGANVSVIAVGDFT